MLRMCSQYGGVRMLFLDLFYLTATRRSSERLSKSNCPVMTNLMILSMVKVGDSPSRYYETETKF